MLIAKTIPQCVKEGFGGQQTIGCDEDKDLSGGMKDVDVVDFIGLLFSISNFDIHRMINNKSTSI